MKAILYILVIVVKSPLWFLQWLFKRKGLALIAIVVVAVLIGVNVYKNRTSASDIEIPSYQRIAPQTIYVGVTPTRVYYLNSYRSEDDYTILTDFFTFDKDKWERQTQPLQIKTIQISKR